MEQPDKIMNRTDILNFELENILMSFGVTKEQAEEIDRTIDNTIKLHFALEGGRLDFPDDGDSR